MEGLGALQGEGRDWDEGHGWAGNPGGGTGDGEAVPVVPEGGCWLGWHLGLGEICEVSEQLSLEGELVRRKYLGYDFWQSWDLGLCGTGQLSNEFCIEDEFIGRVYLR